MGVLIGRLLSDETGSTAVEYGLIGLLVSVTLIAAALYVGGEVTNLYEFVGQKVEGASIE